MASTTGFSCVLCFLRIVRSKGSIFDDEITTDFLKYIRSWLCWVHEQTNKKNYLYIYIQLYIACLKKGMEWWQFDCFCLNFFYLFTCFKKKIDFESTKSTLIVRKKEEKKAIQLVLSSRLIFWVPSHFCVRKSFVAYSQIHLQCISISRRSCLALTCCFCVTAVVYQNRLLSKCYACSRICVLISLFFPFFYFLFFI